MLPIFVALLIRWKRPWSNQERMTKDVIQEKTKVKQLQNLRENCAALKHTWQ